MILYMYQIQTAKRITLNLPAQLLKEAQKVTGKNMTETIITGLEMLRRVRAYDLALQLKGKLKLEIDLEGSRERHY